MTDKADGTKLPQNRAQIMLRKYFDQVTRGCGDTACTNPNCKSNVDRNSSLDSNDTNSAAALAVNLLTSGAPLCPSIIGGGKNQVLSTSQNSSSTLSSNTLKAEGTGESSSTVIEAEEKSSKMDFLETENQSQSKETDYLTEKRLLSLIDECETNHDYGQLRRLLGQIFYSVDSVKKSFLVQDSDGEIDNRSTSKSVVANGGITLDMAQVRSAFRALFAIDDSCSFQRTLVEAIKHLMEETEMELRYQRPYDSNVLNLFILVLEMPLLHEPEFIQDAFPAFCKAVAQVPEEGQTKLARFLSTYSNDQLLNIVYAVQQSITVRLLSGTYGQNHSIQQDEAVTEPTKLLRILYYAALYGGERDNLTHLTEEKEFYETEDKILEDLRRQDEFGENDGETNGSTGASSKETIESKSDPIGKGLSVRPIDSKRPMVPFEEFYNETLSDVIEIDKDFLNYKAEDERFSFMNFPFILLPATKMQSMFYDNRIRMYTERRAALVQTLMGAPTNPYLRLRVRRRHLVQDSLAELEIIAKYAPSDLKKQLYVEFEDEQGVDEGGVSKEFYQLITAELFNPDHGMFTYHPDSRLYWFNSKCVDGAAEYTLIGTLFGLAIYNNIIVDVQFPMVVYKKLLGKLGTLDDLKDVDATLYSSLKQMLDYDGDNFEDVFACTMQIMCTDCYGEQFAHDLKPNGNDISITKENREEFVKLYADYLLNRSMEQQFHAFRRGFCMVCTNESPLSWLFRPDEIEQLVCGSKNFDFTTLERSTDYDNGYNADHHTVKSFWEVIHEMNDDQKRLFLRFVTGSDRIPIGGMGKLKFIIARNGADSEKLPTAHTCFNVLLLPDYKDKEKLKERLLKAITYCEGFGLM